MRSRGPLKDLKDSKLILNASKLFPFSFRISLVPFRTFRGPLFPKTVTGQELFLAVSYSRPALAIFLPIRNLFMRYQGYKTYIVSTSFARALTNFSHKNITFMTWRTTLWIILCPTSTMSWMIITGSGLIWYSWKLRKLRFSYGLTICIRATKHIFTSSFIDSTRVWWSSGTAKI